MKTLIIICSENTKRKTLKKWNKSLANTSKKVIKAESLTKDRPSHFLKFLKSTKCMLLRKRCQILMLKMTIFALNRHRMNWCIWYPRTARKMKWFLNLSASLRTLNRSRISMLMNSIIRIQIGSKSSLRTNMEMLSRIINWKALSYSVLQICLNTNSNLRTFLWNN
jgi:hypothetical protein